MSAYNPFSAPGLLGLKPIKRKVFVSYHHGGDQYYYNEFSRLFSQALELFYDTSLERAVNSDDDEYVRWSIRQNNITGSSCTIVLCGLATPLRKHVDWEIKATLDKQHGIIGIWLPTLPLQTNNGTFKPARLQDNIDSGYAKWLQWEGLTSTLLQTTIEQAVISTKALIVNNRVMRQRNG
jgi:hypothetical protein